MQVEAFSFVAEADILAGISDFLADSWLLLTLAFSQEFN